MGKRVLKITDTLLLDLLERGNEASYRVIEDGLPPDAKIVNFTMQGHWTQARGVAVFLLESEEWGPAPDGEPYPEVRPILQTIYPDGSPA